MKPITTFLFALMATFIFVSCSEKDLYDEEIPEVFTPTDFNMMKTYEVNVKEGTAKEVYVDGELVYSGDMSLTIDLPKSAVATRSVNEVVISPGYGEGWTTISKKGTLLFEDVTNGDNDYNDFVCTIEESLELKYPNNPGGVYFDNVKYAMTGKTIAMGNTLPLSFGVELVIDGKVAKDIMLASNVREKYFKNIEGYLNTIKGEAKVTQNAISHSDNKANGTFSKNSHVSTNYYIIVNGDGVKRYESNSSKAVLTDGGVPYGLFVPSTQTAYKGYSQEFKSFFKAYPNFMKWVKGESDQPFSGANNDYLY